MTNPGPWTPPGTQAQPQAPKSAFQILDMGLTLVMIAAGLLFVFAGIFVVTDGDPEAAMFAGGGLSILLLAGVGRVLVHIARTLDRMAVDAREVRGIGEWWLSHGGGRAGE